MDLKIDPEFRDKIPPLTDAEFEQLRENILADGEVYEPICIWNGTIIDGHNRYKIVQEHPEIPYRTKEMQFADKWEAFDWMYKKQLGRRNLTDEQKTYLLGKLYEARKHSQGAPTGNNNAEKQRMQNAFIESHNGRTMRTYDTIANEQGVNASTVQRSEHYAQGLDKADQVVPGFRQEILSGEVKASKKEIAEIRNMENEEKVKAKVEEIRNPKPKAEPQGIEEVETKAIPKCRTDLGEKIVTGRNLSKRIDEIGKMMSDSNVKHEYTEKDAEEEFEVIMNECMSKLRRVIEVRKETVKGSKSLKSLVNMFSLEVKRLKEEI